MGNSISFMDQSNGLLIVDQQNAHTIGSAAKKIDNGAASTKGWKLHMCTVRAPPVIAGGSELAQGVSCILGGA